MEFLFALLVIAAAAGGLALGLMLTGRPPQTSCGGLACKGACATCPNRKERENA